MPNIWNSGPIFPKQINELLKLLDDHNYESVMMSFRPDEADTFIKAANALNIGGKIKIMVAIRPYVITARYLAMMCKAFEEIDENRLALNIIAGTYDDNQKLFCKPTSLDIRKKECGSFVENMKNSNIQIKYFPTIAFSGSSPEMLENVNKYGDISISMMSDFIKYKNQFDRLSNKRIMVKLWINFLNNIDNITNIKEKENTIYGSKEDIVKKIENLTSMGVTDILISSGTSIDNDIKIHKMIKEMSA
jgi:alkanesulfonate monooxygenase SsuD/methylene tetrahydromethanopterin reductase-like flavin-dependent oxidoreductase (luciferase family)